MKRKYKLKVWAVVCIYLISLGAIISAIVLTSKLLKNSIYSNESLSYVYKSIIDGSVPTVTTQDNKIIKPFTNDSTQIVKEYYDYEASEESQENSLIYYANTYMPNTGILYGNELQFEAICVADGTVEDIIADETIGNIVKIKHTNNLTTIYQSLNEVNIMIGDSLKKGDVIGTSGSNKIDSTFPYMILFEVEYNGSYVNPTTIYDKTIEELS